MLHLSKRGAGRHAASSSPKKRQASASADAPSPKKRPASAEEKAAAAKTAKAEKEAAAKAAADEAQKKMEDILPDESRLIELEGMYSFENELQKSILNLADIIPAYVLNEEKEFDFNNQKIEIKKYDMIPVYGKRVRNNIYNPFIYSLPNLFLYYLKSDFGIIKK